MNPTLKVDIRNFSDMARDMMRRRGMSVKQIVDSEATVILNAAVRRSPAAQVQELVKTHEERQWAVYNGKRYRIAGEGKYGKQKKPHANRYDDVLWATIQSMRRASLRAKLAARGLLKLSWAQIGFSLGLAGIKIPRYAQKAKMPNGKTPLLGEGRRDGGGVMYALTMRNRSLVAIKRNQIALLKEIVRGRVRQYRRAIIEEFRKASQLAASGKGSTVV